MWIGGSAEGGGVVWGVCGDVGEECGCVCDESEGVDRWKGRGGGEREERDWRGELTWASFVF